MNRIVAAVVVAAFVAGPAGLAVAAPREVAPASQKLTLYHWWTSPSESKALSGLVTLFRQKYPEVIVLSTPSPSGPNVRKLFPLIQRMVVDKQPPDAFQMNAGYAGQLFFDAHLLDPIDELWAQDKLEEVIPAVIRDLNKFEGHYYSVPVNVHRTNVVWYNKALLEKHGIDPDTLTTWDAFFKAAQTLQAGGVKNPVQVGINWTVAAVLETVIVSEGIGTYEDWINGKITAPDDARMIKAFTILQKYLSYANKDHTDLAWDVPLRRVMAGEGAFSIMGDWANGEFKAANLKYGKDYGAIPVPGTKGVFGLGVDTFQHPRGIVDQTNSMRWLRLAASREGQDAFNPAKGSIPARTDAADLTRYDPYQRSAIADFKAAKVMYPTLRSALPEGMVSNLNTLLETFSVDQDIDKAAAAMGSASAKAGKSRTWALSAK
jgi:glucose/mannose transport system substrate-binding protein